MEEIDGIIIDSLKNLHCDIDEEVTSLKQFDSDLVVLAISTCLEIIVPGTKFPKKLPPSMSIKLKTASSLAEQIKELGFRGDMGYQTILYFNEAEIRRVLMFLIERLPRETSKISHVEETGYVPCLVKEIEKKVKSCMEQFWLPSNVLRDGYRKTKNGYIFHSFGDCAPLSAKKLQVPQTTISYNNQALKHYWIHNVPPVTRQCKQKELVPSLLFKDCIISSEDKYLRDCFKALTSSESELPTQLMETSEVVSCVVSAEKSEIILEADSSENSENQIEILLAKLAEEKKKYLEFQDTMKSLDVKLSQMNEQKKAEEAVLEELLSKVNLKSKTLTVISKEENLQKLKDLIENNKNRLVHLADQWNEVQKPLLEEYRSLKNTISDEDLKLQEEQNRLKKLQETYRGLKNDIREKTQLEEQLRQKFDQINKNQNRSSYTRRILEIIGNIKKQDDEIQKILNDTRTVQREISILTGQVDRSFTLSDELIFRDAKTDETARKAYKLLAQLRDECSSVIKAVTDLGAVERECRNLQEQIDLETVKESAIKLERVNKDLDEIRKENELLMKQRHS